MQKRQPKALTVLSEVESINTDIVTSSYEHPTPEHSYSSLSDKNCHATDVTAAYLTPLLIT